MVDEDLLYRFVNNVYYVIGIIFLSELTPYKIATVIMVLSIIQLLSMIKFLV